MGLKGYRIIFLGLNGPKDSFIEGMASLGVSQEMADYIVLKAPIILKEKMSLEYARRYADAIYYAGGIVRIQENGTISDLRNPDHSPRIPTLENFIMCPECGLKQFKAAFCKRCGFTLTNNE
ncbi:MAG: hypothetical protein JW932_15995 [Deltaproteobacteria bacterium]|nr:hypothetical protein [Deltaproteobacteria bacterium]